MDYGKLAYLRQEELEARLSDGGADTPVKRSVFLNCSAAAGKKVRLFSVAAACFILNLSFSSGQAGAKITLYADTKPLSVLNYSQNMTFTVAFDEAAACTLYVLSDRPFKIAKAEILVLRGALDEPESSVAIDARGGQTGFVCAEGGRILLSIFDTPTNPLKSQGDAGAGSGGSAVQEIGDCLLLGFGTLADITACTLGGRDCFCVIHRDFYGNVFLVFALKAGGEYSVLDTRFVTFGADTVSVSCEGGNLLAAYSYRGRAYIKSVFGKDGMSCDGCDGIYLVKDSCPPMAILKRDGINSLRVCADELCLHSERIVSVSVALT